MGSLPFGRDRVLESWSGAKLDPTFYNGQLDTWVRTG